MSDARILIVEDEGIEALDIQRRLISLGYPTPEYVFSGEDAVSAARDLYPDLVLMDIMLGGTIDGVAAAEQIRALFNIPVVYLTAYADEDTLKRAKITEPYGYVVKPFRDRELHITIDMALYRHQMERKLRESEKWFATTLRSIGDAVVATDRNGLITFMNAVAEKLTGWKLEEALGHELTAVCTIVCGETRSPVDDPVARAILEGPVARLAEHTRLVARDSTETPIDCNASPIKDDKGNIIGAILVFRDVTEREKAEEELRRANAKLQENWRATVLGWETLKSELRRANARLEERATQRTADLAAANDQLKQEIERRQQAENWLEHKKIEAEHASLAKDSFLSSMSDQLRAVLNAISGFTEALLLLPGPFSDRQQRQLQTIRRNAEYLPSLIGDLLCLAKIELGTMEVNTETVDLASVIREVMSTLKGTAEQKGLTLVESVPQAAMTIRTDRHVLSRILLNLTNTSIKLAPTGTVQLEIARRHEDGGFLTDITVVGTGGMMREEDRRRLLEAFRRPGSVLLPLNDDGAGLDLHLSQRLAKLIGGEVSLKTSDGHGTALSLRLR